MPEPFHKSERNFRRYESLLKQILQAYPNPSFVKPEGLSIETVINRLRDAMKYFLKSSWESDITHAEMKRMVDAFVLTHDGSTIRIGPRIKEADSVPGKIESNRANSLTVERPTYLELQAFACLLQGNRLPMQVTFSYVDPAIAAQVSRDLTDNPLLQFWQEGNNWIML